jgi:hypothetical protein
MTTGRDCSHVGCSPGSPRTTSIAPCAWLVPHLVVASIGGQCLMYAMLFTSMNRKESTPPWGTPSTYTRGPAPVEGDRTPRRAYQ